MSKAKTLATTVSTGGALENPANVLLDSDIGVSVQATLSSGTNIKTVNSTSLLGSGNLVIDSLPSQTGNTGKYLTTDGSTPSWSTLTVSGSGGTTASGSVTLTSASGGAQSITTTSYGQYVKLPDATTVSKAAQLFNITNKGSFPLKVLNNSSQILGFIYPFDSSVVGLADNSTAAGVWDCTNLDLVAATAQFSASVGADTSADAIYIDANRRLFLYITNSSVLYGVVYDGSTNTAGTPTVIRASAAAVYKGVLIGTDSVLVASCSGTTALQAVVLSLSGTTITVGTAATATAALNVSQFRQFNTIGTSYCLTWYSSSASTYIQAFTVSGTTVTIGTGVNMYSASYSASETFTNGASNGLLISLISSTSVGSTPFSVSGTTITKGTVATVATSGVSDILAAPIGSNWIVVYNGSSTFVSASIISVNTGTNTATASSVADVLSIAAAISGSVGVLISGNKAVVAGSSSSTVQVNIVTNTSGTASKGTLVPYTSTYSTASGMQAVLVSGNYAYFYFKSNTVYANALKVDISGSSPTVTSQFRLYLANGAGSSYGGTNFVGLNAQGQRNVASFYGTYNFGPGVGGSYQPLTVITDGNLYLKPTQFITPVGGIAPVNLLQNIPNNELWSMNPMPSTTAQNYVFTRLETTP